MMNHRARRVRKVRLGASSEALVRRGALILEDALRTASLPESDGRLLIVRSLSLGNIRSSQSPASIALLIEQRLRRLNVTALYAEDPAAGAHPVVFFHNEVDAYIRLAVRLAGKSSTDEWFWPLAVKVWRAGMPADEAFRNLLYGAIETQAGVAAAVAMLCELQERRSVSSILSSLRWQDGPLLLRAFGWVKPGLSVHTPTGSSPGKDKEILPDDWACVLDHWTAQWGVDDARTAWLAAIALIADKPQRLLDRDLMLRARRAIRQATLRISPQALWPEERSGEERAEEDISSDADLIDSHTAHRGTLQSLTTDSLPEQAQGNDSPLSTSAASDLAIVKGHESAPWAESLHQSPEDRGVACEWLNTPQRSRFAGIFFLLPVMSRLGISSLLDAAPHLTEFNLPAQLLKYAGRQIGMPASDPIMLALNAMCGEDAPSRCDFTEPAIWREGLCQSGPLIVRRVKGEPNARALFDGSGRLALGLWRGRASTTVRELIGGLTIRRGTPMDYEPDAEILFKSWLIAMRRWCHLYARLGLFDLAHRPGRFSATRTHIDVIFDHRHADIRVRKAGLDLDPGWIDWFGRVVLFHYLYGEDL